MSTIAFRDILRRYIVPMFPGAYLRDPSVDYDFTVPALWDPKEPTEIGVRWIKADNKSRYFKISRYQEFSREEADLVAQVLSNIQGAEAIQASYLFEEIIPPAIRRAVAQKTAPLAVDLVTSLLRRLEHWAERTYEGRPITAAFGVDPAAQAKDSVNVTEILETDFGVVMANGLETFLTLSADGTVAGYEPLPDDAISTKVLCPLRFARLAQWAAGDRVGMALTRNGEILVFRRGVLAFARRRAVWHYFPHTAVISRMRMSNSVDGLVAKAVYETCLDVSFARTGGGIGILKKDRLKSVLEGDMIGISDRVGADSAKGKFLRAIVGKLKFQQIDRRLRQDLVAIDGSTVLDSSGNVLAVGAILKISAGSTGGGRLAAAKTLSHHGLGLKISSDGAVQGFRLQMNPETKKQEPRKSFQLA